ncbi:MAG: EF-hand domain-containing protein [Chthonomonadales bacterium]
MFKNRSFLVTGGMSLCAIASLQTLSSAKQGPMESPINTIMLNAKNKDGKLRKSEIKDNNKFLRDHFADADTNHDGGISKDELRAYFMKQSAAHAPGGNSGGGGRGAGGGGGMMGGGGFGPPPKPGTIMPDGFANMLKLTPDQKKQFAVVQKDVDGRLAKILTDAQKKQLTAASSQPMGGMGGGRPGGGGAPGGGMGGRPGGGGAPGGPPGGGMGGRPGGGGAPGGAPRKRTILPGRIMEQLKVTPAQTKQLEDLQTSVDAKRDKILTAEQKKTIADMRARFGGGGMGGRPGGGMLGGPPPGAPKK